MIAPPYPADLEAKGWCLDLDYERIEQSDTWAIASAEQRPWLLMLWLIAWRQVPVASLPNDHRLIAARIGMPVAMFSEWADVLLSGWDLADDGRLYHKTLTQHALRMVEKRSKDRARVAAYRAESQRVAACNALHTRESRVSSTPTPTPTEKEQSIPTTSGAEAPQPDPIFGSGLAFLLSKGLKERGARSFLGAMRKELGEVRTAELLARAEQEDVSDPAAWLRAAANRSAGGNVRQMPVGRQLREL
jgi:hypothetical protein